MTEVVLYGTGGMGLWLSIVETAYGDGGAEVLQMQGTEAQELIVQSANHKFENLAPEGKRG